MAFTVSVLRNREGRLYIGQTRSIEQRLAEHQAGMANWTKSRGPWELVHAEQYPTRAEAMSRGKTLKSGRANQALRDKFGGGC